METSVARFVGVYRQEVICDRCRRSFWPTSSLVKTCGDCEHQARRRTREEQEDTKKAMNYVVFWFLPIVVLWISSKMGTTVHSLIPEILPVMGLAVGFLFAVWIVLAQWVFSKISE